MWLSTAGGPGSAGAGIYAEHCSACHGAALEGQPDWRSRKPDGRLPAPPHDASGHTWHHSDDQLFRIVKEGTAALAPPGYVSDMPGFSGVLTDRQIRDVLAYIRSTWPSDIQARQQQISRAAR
nr:cytochrome c [Arenibaculum pallidiluteum]